MTYPANTPTPIDPVKLDKLAEVAIKVGLQLQKGQDLVMTAPIAAMPLVRDIAKHAYKAGAGLVTTFYSDEETTLARYAYAPDESFDRASDWLYEGMAKAFGGGAARLAISGDNPMMLSAQDPSKVARANKANSIAYKPALEKITNFDINWNIVSYPNPAWAQLVFPNDPEPIAVEKLANAIFAASRVDLDDPVAAWKAHNANLARRSAWLNGERFASTASASRRWPGRCRRQGATAMASTSPSAPATSRSTSTRSRSRVRTRRRRRSSARYARSTSGTCSQRMGGRWRRSFSASAGRSA